MSEPQRDVQQEIAETATGRMLRQIAKKRFMSSLDVPLLESAADEADRLVAEREEARRMTEERSTAFAVLPHVQQAARALVTKLDEVHSNPSWQSAMVTAYLHGHRYDGPTYSEELEALRRVVGVAAPDAEKAGA